MACSIQSNTSSVAVDHAYLPAPWVTPNAIEEAGRILLSADPLCEFTRCAPSDETARGYWHDVRQYVTGAVPKAVAQ